MNYSVGLDEAVSAKWRTEDATDESQRQCHVVLVGWQDLSAAPPLRDDDRFAVRCVATGSRAVQTLKERGADCVVSTDQLPKMSCLELLEQVRDQHCALPFVLVSTQGSERLASDAVAAGVTEYVPIDAGERLEERIRDAVGHRRERINTAELDELDAAIEHAADAILITNAEGVIEYVNPAFEELTGYCREEAIGLTPRILKSGKQGRSYYERMWDTILDGEVWEETIINQTKSGSQYIAHQTVAPVLDESGTVQRFVGIQRDITRRQRLEEQLERSETTLTRIYEQSLDPETDLRDKVENVLETGVRHLGYETAYFTRIADGTQTIQAATGDIETVEADKTDPLEQTYCQRTVDSNDPVVISDAETAGDDIEAAYEEFGLRCYVGAKVVVDGTVYGTLCFASQHPRDRLILDAHQSTVQTLANWIGYEIEREQYETKLEQQNERLEKFASAVSHDLRNPLNVAQAHTTLTSCEDEHLEQIQQAHDRMATIIDETLTIAREGKLVEQPEPVSLACTARDSWANVATGEGTLTVDRDATIQADADRLRRIFENLFRNAVEHAGEDVTVRVGATPDGFYVADDGPGIDPDERQAVFEHGYSEDCGSGFGLSIVETLAHAHGWSVSVGESDEGGARFVFDFDGSTEPCLVC